MHNILRGQEVTQHVSPGWLGFIDPQQSFAQRFLTCHIPEEQESICIHTTRLTADGAKQLATHE